MIYNVKQYIKVQIKMSTKQFFRYRESGTTWYRTAVSIKSLKKKKSSRSAWTMVKVGWNLGETSLEVFSSFPWRKHGGNLCERFKIILMCLDIHMTIIFIRGQNSSNLTLFSKIVFFT